MENIKAQHIGDHIAPDEYWYPNRAVIEIRDKAAYEAHTKLKDVILPLIDYPKEDLDAWANGNEPITITILPVHLKNLIAAINI